MGKQLNEAARMLGRKGGLTAARRMTPEQKRERGCRGMRNRWARQTDLDLLRLVRDVRELSADTAGKPRCTGERKRAHASGKVIA